MKKILITGATGFIGSHLTEYFVKSGYAVKAFDRYNPNNHWGWLENSQYINDVEIILGDIRDYDSVFHSMKECSAVLHLAALIGIPYSYVSPLAYIRTNIEGTYNVLEASKNLDIDNILVTSTSEVYGTAQYVPMDESHPCVGQSPYSASKISADQLSISYYRSFDLPIKIVRPFNTFGPRQSARAVIPTIMLQLLKNNVKGFKLGDLSPTRDFTYVKDTCSGFMEILKSEKLFGEAVNIGMNQEISIKDLSDIIAKILGKDGFQITVDKDRVRPKKSEVNRLYCDNSKIKKNTYWKPEYNLELGLKETLEWFKQNNNAYKPDTYNI
tara:strand:- start:2348 stop:3328 length:981 start_codon:yes stop_codon:yes gene_type:complete